MALLPKKTRATKCPRCGLNYPAKSPHCVYCHNLDDAEVEMLKRKHQKQLDGLNDLGKGFFIIAVVILVVVWLWAG